MNNEIEDAIYYYEHYGIKHMIKGEKKWKKNKKFF